jgi:hypothetical protein
MKENVGRTDRIMRLALGPAMIALGYAGLGGDRGRPAGLATMLGGALVLESGVTRVCPLNAVLGIDTRSDAERLRDHTALTPPNAWERPLDVEENAMRSYPV